MATKSDPSLFSTRSPVPSPQRSFEKASLENGNISSENFGMSLDASPCANFSLAQCPTVLRCS